MDDLSRAVEVAEMAVAATPQGHPDRPGRLNNLGNRLGSRFERTGSMDDLSLAVEVADMAVAATPQGHPDRAAMLNNLGCWLGSRFKHTGSMSSMDDLSRAVEVAEMAVDATPQDHPNRAAMLTNLGNRLGSRFERTGSMDDLDRAVEVAEMAVAATPQDHPDRAGWLNNLGSRLGSRFERTGSMDDLSRAVEVAEMAVDATPQDHPNRAAMLTNLGNRLGSRFERTGSMDDLDRAVEVAEMAVAATPQDHPDRATMLSNFGCILHSRFERTGSMDELSRAVEAAEMAVAATPQDHPDRAGWLNNLGSRLGSRFERTGSMDDLSRAVEVAEMAVDATPQDHPNRAAMLTNLGNRLGSRFERTGSMDDLDRAVEVAEMAVAATPQDHPDRAGRLNNLGNRFGSRFERTGSMDDLSRAVEVAEMAVDATPQDHPNRAAMLTNLGNRLGSRFERTGSMDDLDRAVEVAEMAVAATPQDHPDRAGWLNNLGSRLGSRFERTGSMDDLSRAAPRGTGSAKVGGNYAPVLRRFERTGSMDDLSRAVEVAEMAVAATPQDHPDRATMLSNFGCILHSRFERTGSMDELSRAVEAAEMAVAATPQDHPDRAGRLNNLGTPQDHPDRARRLSNLGYSLRSRFERTGSMDDLDRAVEVADIAVAVTPQDHPDRARRLNNLGNRLGSRFKRTGSMDDLDRALSSYKKGWHCEVAPPSWRIHLAREAARILTRRLNWDESSQLLEEAVKLLPTVSPRSLQNADKQHMLSDFAGLASMAAATALNAGREANHALRLLELGRGVIAGFLLEMRTDVSDLEQQHPGLATEFKSLRDVLDSPADRTMLPTSRESPLSQESQLKRRREAEIRFNEVVHEIRTHPGFEDFLRPPAAEQLMAAARLGPVVVVNAHSFRCDAFIVDRHEIKALQLPNLNLHDAKRNVKRLRSSNLSEGLSVLEWLWIVAACPIMVALGFKQPPSNDDWPHVWWILTGQVSQLPFHAAGRHVKGSSDSVLDRVISSYGTSIKALMDRRRQDDLDSKQLVPGAALLLAMGETPGQSALPFATHEVEILNGLCPSLKLKPVMPPRRRQDVLAHLSSCTIFHFAGHGNTDPTEPSKSSLLLDDWEESPLTVADLRDHSIHESSPFLAYLSACSTGANEVERFAEEAIHLISACQLAGFRHVVGTLWEVWDEHCVDVARVLYETLRDEGMTDTAICRGLHQAVRALREQERAYIGGSDTDAAVTQDGAHNDVADEQDARSSAREDYLREGRNVVLCGRPNTRQATHLSWVPYVHFGALTVKPT
ncbi:hypothetical protein HIM_07753 [Hirsutella minnesotensis 3608]|uniref:CHAT domain-containing protein n=1 Tax=Hirsutella minnesotensis 3608 TaxID=1043627 RepID=A0A0F8A419_9HYPO|nr:hypothetical protein HIM_07753 [Hirsutella minnesotensis 3608]